MQNLLAVVVAEGNIFKFKKRVACRHSLPLFDLHIRREVQDLRDAVEPRERKLE